MSFWKRLFSRGDLPPPPAGPVFSRESPPTAPVPAGERRAALLQQASIILERDVSDIDVAASLEADYGCADLDILECVQAAEEIWGVQLCPNPMTAEDFDYLVKRLPTLQAIIADAERRSASQR